MATTTETRVVRDLADVDPGYVRTVAEVALEMAQARTAWETASEAVRVGQGDAHALGAAHLAAWEAYNSKARLCANLALMFLTTAPRDHYPITADTAPEVG